MRRALSWMSQKWSHSRFGIKTPNTCSRIGTADKESSPIARKLNGSRDSVLGISLHNKSSIDGVKNQDAGISKAPGNNKFSTGRQSNVLDRLGMAELSQFGFLLIEMSAELFIPKGNHALFPKNENSRRILTNPHRANDPIVMNGVANWQSTFRCNQCHRMGIGEGEFRTIG